MVLSFPCFVSFWFLYLVCSGRFLFIIISKFIISIQNRYFFYFSILEKVFKNGWSGICGRQPLKNLKWFVFSTSNFLKAVFYLVHSWILCPIWFSYMCLTRSTSLFVPHVYLGFFVLFEEFPMPQHVLKIVIITRSCVWFYHNTAQKAAHKGFPQ